MKRNLLFIAVAFALTTIFASGRSVSQSEAATESTRMIYYTWYYDWDHTQPVGTYATLSQELQRLRSIWPEYIFSSTPQMGLVAFEHGDHGSWQDQLIFSDIPWD